MEINDNPNNIAGIPKGHMSIICGGRGRSVFTKDQERYYYCIYNPIEEKFVELFTNQDANKNKIPFKWNEYEGTPFVESNIWLICCSKKPRNFKIKGTSTVFRPDDYQKWLVVPTNDPFDIDCIDFRNAIRVMDW